MVLWTYEDYQAALLTLHQYREMLNAERMSIAINFSFMPTNYDKISQYEKIVDELETSIKNYENRTNKKG